MADAAALWPSPWPAEDGGPARRQAAGGGLRVAAGERLVATSRTAVASTMVVLRDPGEVFLLCHTGGEEAVSWVERIDPVTLDPLGRSPDLPGGPAWPGGLAAHAGGSLHVVFGNHAHRLSPGLDVQASRLLPRARPYNSFVVLPDGHLVTKDFGGSRPGAPVSGPPPATELLVLDPEGLDVVAVHPLPEPSIARLSARGSEVVVVGEDSVFTVGWDGRRLERGRRVRYRTEPGQTYGWDAVVDGGAAWFLDDGEGSDRYNGSLRGLGLSDAPLRLHRVDLDAGGRTSAEVCGLRGGLVANPPAVDLERGVAVGYDSGNGRVAGFTVDRDGSLRRRWEKALDHAAHPLRYPETGELVLHHFDRQRGAEQLVVLDIETGAELARVDTGSPVQSVVFPAAGFDRDLYTCSFTTVTRIHVDTA
jgi:hypothetical protein